MKYSRKNGLSFGLPELSAEGLICGCVDSRVVVPFGAAQCRTMAHLNVSNVHRCNSESRMNLNGHPYHS